MSVNSDNCAKMLKKNVIDELVRLAIIFSSETEKCEHHYIIRSAVGPISLGLIWILVLGLCHGIFLEENWSLGCNQLHEK